MAHPTLEKLLSIIIGPAKPSPIENQEEKPHYPIEVLKNYVGQMLEFHHINQDLPKIERVLLINIASPEMIYVGESPEHMYLLDCYSVSPTSNKLDAVRLISDLDGNVIYENPSVPFEYHLVRRSG